MEQKSEIVLYQPEGAISLEVRLENETVWLTQQQISELFGTGRQAITKHLKNIFASNELDENSVCSILELTAADGKNYKTKVYNLDAILSVGYRVNSKNATLFRRWANSVLKDYMLKGYSLNHRFERLEDKIDTRFQRYDSEIQRLSNQVDFFVRHSLPPIEGIFFAGQIFDAYKFVCDLVKSARKSIVLFDNYIDESVLTLFGKREKSVSVVIYTDKITPQLELDIKLCFRVIDLEVVKYKGFKDDGKFYLAEQVLQSKRGMERMLAALLGQPVEKLAEIRKLI